MSVRTFITRERPYMALSCPSTPSCSQTTQTVVVVPRLKRWKVALFHIEVEELDYGGRVRRIGIPAALPRSAVAAAAAVVVIGVWIERA